jgi:glyoxylase-like metal-dependent hydrolase (beta-lactamase superfamily II)
LFRVRFVSSGTFVAPCAVVGRGWRGRVRLPNVVAVCERDDRSIWLVDAGFSAQTCADPVGTLGRARVASLGLQLRAGDDVASKMSAAGLDPGKVTTIIATHLHLDHVGGAADFPNAEVIVARQESDLAHRAGPLRAYRQQDLARTGRMRLVDLEPRTVLGFPRSRRLDDEVTLADASGHTLGQLAVVIRSESGTWLHAGDAAYQMSAVRTGRVTPLGRVMADDVARLRRTHGILRTINDAGSARLVLSHDPDLFAALPQLNP